MATIQKISFKSEDSTNLLDKFRSTNTMPAQVNKQAPETSQKNNSAPDKTLMYVSSALALTSLGVTGAIAIKNGKLNKVVKNLTSELENANSAVTRLSEELRNGADNLQQKSEELIQKFENSLSDKDKQIKDLGKWQDGQINGVKEELSSRIQQITSSVQSDGMESIILKPVNVNGIELRVASVMNGYGKYTQDIERDLRSEATKRIFGIIDRSKITPKDEIMIRVPTSEFKGFSSTGGMSVVPREVVANLGAIVNSKQKTRLIVDTPMYLGQVQNDVYYSIVRKGEKEYEYISSASKKPLAKLEKIDEMRLPIYTEKGKSDQVVEVFMARNNEQIVDLDLLLPKLEQKLSEKIKHAISKKEPFEINSGSLTVKYDPSSEKYRKPTALIKFDTVFYKNDKFRMDGPLFEGTNKNIYNNATHEAGETERFIYFDKFFYENLIRNHESSKEHLRADLIIGNDWQTGGISAMMRLLPIVKKHFGMDPKVAQKIYQTPILTIMHNAGLAGDVWHSQPKLLNVMFGEHAEMITKNAWMPQNAGLNSDSLNGLFHGTNLNPQTMAAAYSDVITPVSEGYGKEMASHSGFGGNNHDIFRMRGRYHEFGDVEHVKYIARQSGADDKLVVPESVGYKPITNGCDRVNNILTEESARKIESALGLKLGSIRVYKKGENLLHWHKHNKDVYLRKVISDLNQAKSGNGNPMNIELPEMTNLDGVNMNTMVVSTAGRIADQKGLDIFAKSIEEFLTRHSNEENLPLFYAQGVGDNVYIDALLDVKKRIAYKFGQKAADRIVFARLFSEAGRYDGCKLMSDFTVMSSWFEPCGLVHKEIAAFSGSIPLVNKVGGLTDGLKDGFNAIFSEFHHKYENYEEAIEFNKKAFADALDKAYALFNDKNKFAKVLENSYNANHSWLKENGPMEKYAKVFVDLKVLKPEIIQ